MHFYDRKDCLNVSPFVDAYGTKSGIFIFKNIVPQDLIEKIESGLNALPAENPKYDQGLMSWYTEKLAPAVPGTLELWEFMGELLAPNWIIHPQNAYIRVQPGDDGMFIHSDSPGKGQCHLLSQNDLWKTCCELDYGVCAYFGDFEGGEIFYPNVNSDGTLKTTNEDFAKDCFQYKPQKGDIVIHSAFDPYNHGVRDVVSGTRYCFSNFSLKTIDNPGTFHIYDTPEYHKQLGGRTVEEIKAWMVPLKENPQFSPDKLKVYQESGLEGEELAKTFFKDMVEE